MSQSSQDFFIPVDELRRIPSRFVVTRRGGISREQLLDDLSLPQELECVAPPPMRISVVGKPLTHSLIYP